MTQLARSQQLRLAQLFVGKVGQVADGRSPIRRRSPAGADARLRVIDLEVQGTVHEHSD